MPWNEVPAENLSQIFQNHLPVCWNCYIAEAFRKKNPERTVDRAWERGASGEYVPNGQALRAEKPHNSEPF